VDGGGEGAHRGGERGARRQHLRGRAAEWDEPRLAYGLAAGVAPEAAPAETPLFVPVIGAEELALTSPGHRDPAAREPAPGRIEMDLRNGRLVFHGTVDPGLAAAVVAAARGRG
jgi:hypothetical protein